MISFCHPPARKEMEPESCAVRMKPAEFFAAEYSMVSWGEYADRKMGYTYQTRPAENRSSGFFQPEYIRHFLIKSIEKERNKKQF